jgi:hypothetical protein
MGLTLKEGRRSPRGRHDSVVEIYDDSGKFIADVVRLVNFSSVGACFSSPKLFAVNARLRLRLRLLREGRLNVSGRIVWAKKRVNTILYGIEFEKVLKAA